MTDKHIVSSKGVFNCCFQGDNGEQGASGFPGVDGLDGLPGPRGPQVSLDMTQILLFQ